MVMFTEIASWTSIVITLNVRIMIAVIVLGILDVTVGCSINSFDDTSDDNNHNIDHHGEANTNKESL